MPPNGFFWRSRKRGMVWATLRPGIWGRVAGTYEKSVARLPYVIAYALSEDDAALRVIHISRDWQVDAWPG